MLFENDLKHNIVPEWTEFYLNYESLKHTLEPFKRNNFYDDKSYSEQSLGNFLLENNEELNAAGQAFSEELIIQQNRVYHFYIENLNYYSKRVNKFSDHLNHIRLNEKYKKYKDLYEKAIKELYKEMNLMKDFISVNQKIEEKIIKKYIKYAQTCVDKRELSKNINNLKSYTLKEISKNNNLNNLISELEKVFNKNYYYKYKLNTISILKKYIVSPGMKTEEYYFFGVYTGILIVFLCIILIVCLNFDIDMDD